ncbi:Trichodiene oxygenase [Paramyrothecium foliicola]|nr:Trichodiene oxygenase [Paramyrothecium foliicola]
MDAILVGLARFWFELVPTHLQREIWGLVITSFSEHSEEEQKRRKEKKRGKKEEKVSGAFTSLQGSVSSVGIYKNFRPPSCTLAVTVMEALTSLLSWQSIAATIVIYYVTVAIYRLYLHPLARFPGPKLAAVSRWYEGYYDLYLEGQYTFKIAELHKKYGPIIRISPHELHIHDAAWFDTLYNRQEGVWHKYDWSVDAFATKGATIWTADHNLHKNRRLPLSPYFSKVKVNNQHEMIQKHVQRLMDRLALFAESQKTVDLGAAFTAFVRDVVNEYLLGKHYNDIQKEDFDAGMVVAAQAGGLLWRTTKFVRFFGPLMRSIPEEWMIAVGEPHIKEWFRFQISSKNDAKTFMKAAGNPNDDGPRTLVHDLVQSKLPAAEKTFERIFDELSITTGAGFETTAAVLRIAAFHIYSDRKILQRLQDEIAAAPNREWKSIEQLPYLTAVIMESMRLAPALATRSARIAQDKDLFYGD